MNISGHLNTLYILSIIIVSVTCIDEAFRPKNFCHSMSSRVLIFLPENFHMTVYNKFILLRQLNLCYLNLVAK